MCLALDVDNLVYFILKNGEKKSFKITILFHFMKKNHQFAKFWRKRNTIQAKDIHHQ
jgi:hypothetical protein